MNDLPPVKWAPLVSPEASASLGRLVSALDRLHMDLLAVSGRWPYGYDIEQSEPRLEGDAYVTKVRLVPRPPPREIRPEEIALDDPQASGDQE